ncbi:hypothetical protein [uncultured Nostoc sp.]
MSFQKWCQILERCDRPMTNTQCPMTNAQYPMPKTNKYLSKARGII